MSYFGGVGIAAVNEVRELRRLGIDADLVVIFRKKEFDSIEAFGAKDIPVIFLSDRLPKFFRLNFKIPGFSFFSFFHISSIFWAPFVIDKYDVIVAHETYNCFSAIVCAKKTKARLISFIWDPVSYILPRVYGEKFPNFLRPVIKKGSLLIDKYIIKHSLAVLVCSNLHENILKIIAGRSKVFKLFPGAEIIKSLPKNKRKIIVSLTKWDIGKNPELLLKIALKLKGNFQWKVAGNWVDQALLDNFKNQIIEYGLEKKIVVTGKVFGQQKLKLLKESVILVHPIIEAFGMFALEAAGCGCPSILPRGSGVCELFEDKVSGFFPKEGDINSYAKFINEILKDEKKALLMGKKAWEISKNYSWKQHSKRLSDIISKA